jgi:hypothetical protein
MYFVDIIIPSAKFNPGGSSAPGFLKIKNQAGLCDKAVFLSGIGMKGLLNSAGGKMWMTA